MFTQRKISENPPKINFKMVSFENTGLEMTVVLPSSQGPALVTVKGSTINKEKS